MSTNNSNNDFFSYQGTINRKNYLINLFILFSVYLLLTFIRPDFFVKYTSFKFLLPILVFIISLLKFVIIMASLSVIYRRIADISQFKSFNLKVWLNRIFIFIFVLPVLYMFCFRYFIDIMPFIQTIADMFVIYIAMPIALICLIIFSFIKGE